MELKCTSQNQNKKGIENKNIGLWVSFTWHHCSTTNFIFTVNHHCSFGKRSTSYSYAYTKEAAGRQAYTHIHRVMHVDYGGKTLPLQAHFSTNELNRSRSSLINVPTDPKRFLVRWQQFLLTDYEYWCRLLQHLCCAQYKTVSSE